MSIGERITSLRKKHNISQAELAKILNISRQAVSKWENDLSAPDTIRLIQLADVLDTDVEYLATGNHTLSPAKPTIVTIEKPVERVVEKPITVEKIIEVEKPVEIVIEKPVIKKINRTTYIRNPLEFLIVGILSFIFGVIVGIMI